MSIFLNCSGKEEQKASWTKHFRGKSTERASFIDSGAKRLFRCLPGFGLCPPPNLLLPKPESIRLNVMTEEMPLVHQRCVSRSAMSHEQPLPGRETVTFPMRCVIWFHSWWRALLKAASSTFEKWIVKVMTTLHRIQTVLACTLMKPFCQTISTLKTFSVKTTFFN